MAKTRTNEEWLELVRRQRASGLTIEAWCEENAVNLHTMVDRISRLRKMGLLNEPKPAGGRHCARRTATELKRYAQTQMTEWVELCETVATPDTCKICVEIGAFKIVVSDDFQEAAFLRVCKMLESIC